MENSACTHLGRIRQKLNPIHFKIFQIEQSYWEEPLFLLILAYEWINQFRLPSSMFVLQKPQANKRAGRRHNIFVLACRHRTESLLLLLSDSVRHHQFIVMPLSRIRNATVKKAPAYINKRCGGWVSNLAWTSPRGALNVVMPHRIAPITI